VATIQRFEEIEAWQTARVVARKVYEASGRGTFGRDFALRDQMRRAAVSVLSNIAEGFESGTRPQFLRYLGFAKASAGEVRAQLYVALDVGHLSEQEFDELRTWQKSAVGSSTGSWSISRQIRSRGESRNQGLSMSSVRTLAR
jgi:four helix bundle protein